MDFVDKEHRVGVVLHLGHYCLEAFLKVAAVTGASQQRPHIERVYSGARQHFGGLPRDDLVGQTLGNGGFANAGIADQKGVILAAAAEHLDTPLNLAVATDKGVYVAFGSLFVQVHAVFREGGFFVFAGVRAVILRLNRGIIFEV